MPRTGMLPHVSCSAGRARCRYRLQKASFETRWSLCTHNRGTARHAPKVPANSAIIAMQTAKAIQRLSRTKFAGTHMVSAVRSWVLLLLVLGAAAATPAGAGETATASGVDPAYNHGGSGGGAHHGGGGGGPPDTRRCSLTRSCVPTSREYNNLLVVPPAPASLWPECYGPFVLCSIANCTIVRGSGTPRVPLQAACGCLAPRRDGGVVGTSYVTPNIIKSRQTYEATVRRCFGGADPSAPGANTTCTTANSAPVCAAINARTMYGGAWPLFSTFAVFTDQGTQACNGTGTPSSLVADCMTAACYRKRAFDGSPFTCYCPVYVVPAGDSYNLGYSRTKYPNGIPCAQPRGYVISGA